MAAARRYTKEERAEALRLAAEMGVRRAARELGIPDGTVAYWRYLARRGSGAAAGRGELEAREGTEGGEASEPGSRTAPESGGRAKRVRRIYTPSERARILEYAAAHGVRAACREFGVSRWSVREWRRRVRAHAAGEAATSPVVGEEDAAAERTRRILAVWRRHPGLGPSQVRNQLRREGLKVSVHTVRVTMEEHGYVPPKARRKEVHDERYEAVRPNMLWHADFLHRRVHKAPVYVLLFVDDFSRFIVGWALEDGERAESVIRTFEAAVARHGRPEAVMTDRGSGFWSWRGASQFTKVLEEYEVDHWVARTPQVNGKVEVLNANLQKELFDVSRFFDLAEARRHLAAWVDFYNYRRTHHALGGVLVPADRYHGRADRVLRAIEEGRSPEGIAESASWTARPVDLLRIRRHAGEIEVTLLGHRLWSASLEGG